MKKLALAISIAVLSPNLYAAAGDEYGPVYEVRGAYIKTAGARVDKSFLRITDPDLMPTVCSPDGAVKIDMSRDLAKLATLIAIDASFYGLPVGIFTYTHDGDDCWLGKIQLIEVNVEPDLFPSDGLSLSQVVTDGRLIATGCPDPMTQGELIYQRDHRPIGTDTWYTEVGQMETLTGSTCISVHTHIFRPDMEYQWTVRDENGAWTPDTPLFNPTI